MSNTKMRKRRKFEHWQIISLYLIIYDMIAVNAAYIVALLLRFDFLFSHIPERYLSSYIHFSPIYTVFCIFTFTVLRLYKSLWRYASFSELNRIIISSFATFLFHTVFITLFFTRMPISYYLTGAILQFGAIAAVRFSYRFILIEHQRRTKNANDKLTSRIMMVGAGNAGQMLMRDLHKQVETRERVVCVIDDNPNKWGRYLDGVPIVGGRDEILSSVEKFRIDKIYVAIPSATPQQIRDILNICKETGCELKNLPGMFQFVTGEITASKMKTVAVEDLLGRDPIKVDLTEISGYLTGKVVLVTGGGGSIGSELVRQIARSLPKQLIVFDIYENNAYEIQQEMKKKYPDLDLVTLIGSVRDSRRLDQIFEEYQPQIVYHAAAHKHVPLMEDSPCEAIKNNAIGTYKTAFAAMMYGCERFVLISTDKAVNPTNIMGASKRLCEMVIQSFAHMIAAGRELDIPVLHTHADDESPEYPENMKPRARSHTKFVAVRFGNVLGSNGSVIPLFKKQIEEGGPVTVTHPDIIRYFMTIPEAVSLVLQAGYYADSGSIYVLDMGDPVKIDTLARNLIKLSGLKPDVDIEVKYTGLRPGEKLYEEKLMAEEGMKTTPNKLIHIGNPIPFDTDVFLGQLNDLMCVSYNNDEKSIRKLVKEIVKTYSPAGRHGSESKGRTYDRLVREMQAHKKKANQ